MDKIAELIKDIKQLDISILELQSKRQQLKDELNDESNADNIRYILSLCR